jgi:lysozyme
MPVVNDAALDLICSFEGWVNHWYVDPVGIWTCCFGHTDAAGEPKYANTKTKVFTKAEGRMILERDLATYAAHVRKAVHVALTDNQYGALVSLCYNIGPSNFMSSTLVKKLNAGDYEGAADQFARWNKGRVKGKLTELKGLTRRRAAEAALFRSGATVPGAPEMPASEAPESLIAVFLRLVTAFINLFIGGRK